MTELTGFPSAAVPVALAVYGIGMTTGALRSGRVAAYGLMRGIFFLAAIAVILALFGFAAHNGVTSVLAVFLLGMVPTILVPMLQTRLMDVAHEGQSLAAALNHSTLNMAKALGAFLGSVVLQAGYGYEWPSRRACCWPWRAWASPRSRCSSTDANVAVPDVTGPAESCLTTRRTRRAGSRSVVLPSPPAGAACPCPSRGHGRMDYGLCPEPSPLSENPYRESVSRILR